MARNESINIRLTTEEKAEILAMCKSDGYGSNISEFMRRTFLEKHLKTILENKSNEIKSDTTKIQKDTSDLFLLWNKANNEIKELKEQNKKIMSVLEFILLKKDVYEKSLMGKKDNLTEEAKILLKSLV